MKIFDTKNICLWRCHFSLHRFKSVENFWTISQGYCACFGFFLLKLYARWIGSWIGFGFNNVKWLLEEKIQNTAWRFCSYLLPIYFHMSQWCFLQNFFCEKKMYVRKFLIYYILMIFFLYESHLYIAFF